MQSKLLNIPVRYLSLFGSRRRRISVGILFVVFSVKKLKQEKILKILMTLFIYLHSSRFTFSILAFEFFIHQGHSEFIFIFKSYPIFINLIFENYFPSSLKRRSCLFQIIFVKSGSLIVMNLHSGDLLPCLGLIELRILGMFRYEIN